MSYHVFDSAVFAPRALSTEKKEQLVKMRSSLKDRPLINDRLSLKQVITAGIKTCHVQIAILNANLCK
jgi:hypothetical protein